MATGLHIQFVANNIEKHHHAVFKARRKKKGLVDKIEAIEAVTTESAPRLL